MEQIDIDEKNKPKIRWTRSPGEYLVKSCEITLHINDNTVTSKLDTSIQTLQRSFRVNPKYEKAWNRMTRKEPSEKY